LKNDQLDVLLDLAERAARCAGVLLKSAAAGLYNVDRDMSHDLKLQADREAETLILDMLRRESMLPILSEEAGSISGSESSLRWIVDPLDGTINFSRGIPASCVSIGLWDGGSPLLGIIHDFNRDETFRGLVGKGAWLNGSPVQVSDIEQKQKAILFTGFPARADLSDAALKVFMANVRDYRKVRWIGSAALSLAYVACGRGDVYAEKGIMIWDIAGALPVLAAAGGQYRMEPHGVAYDILATNGRLMTGNSARKSVDP
jgi:myo-inositol-1(or 4)-monophosphatase